MPEIAVPLATYTGWNFQNERSSAPNQLAALTGGMIPFARTKVEREKSNNPRPSVEERYKTREQYLDLITKSVSCSTPSLFLSTMSKRPSLFSALPRIVSPQR